MNQVSIFDEMYDEISITKPIRLIELFAGYGSQAMALKRIGAKFEHYKVIEIDKFAVASYNIVHGTDFKPTDITKVHAKDLEIVDKDKYCYLMTYSFPCTDLSIAGKQKGMAEGSNTRSSLLWEVKRILQEMDEKPQILFMENVTQVHNQQNIADFNKWLLFLESIGYKNYYQDLNAKDYGVPQNRLRCYMFSLLGNYIYHFPEKIVGGDHKRLRDYLEKDVDEKWYLKSDKVTKLLEQLVINDVCKKENPETFLSVRYPPEFLRKTDIASTLCARDQNGFSNFLRTNTVAEKIKIKQATKQGYIECEDGGVFDASYPNSKLRRGRVQGGWGSFHLH